MKTFLFSLLSFLISFSGITQSGSGNLSNGLRFENPQLQSGVDLALGAEYLFSNVSNNTDAIVSIDSLINGATVNKIDDNSNGTGYKEAFQPAIKSGGSIGISYVVFKIKFYEHGTTNPVVLQTVNATALDLDGNNSLKEFCRINAGAGATMAYMATTTDISVSQMLPGDFMGQNILGIERAGIDTLSYNNMFTATNSNISSFSVKYGSITSNSTSATRQYSLFMKGFYYPGSTLPVKMYSFTANLNNSKVDLKWVTASEINVSHFIVEKSTDGVNFSEAGLMFAYGNATDKTNYSLSDNVNTNQAGVIYYRLRSIDVDGKSELSETRIIRIGKQTEKNISIVTYPNPVSNEVRITIPANWQNKKVVYEIFNAAGKAIKRTETANSSQTETMNVSSFAPGFYIVRASFDGQTAQQKIVKQ